MFRKVLWNNGVETGEDEEVVCSIKKPKGQEDGEVDVSRQRTRLETYIRRWKHWGGKKGGKRRRVKGEHGGGCGFPSWLLLIFCKPQSASAISIHFLLFSFPFSPPSPTSACSNTLLTHPPPPPPPHTLHHFITIPPCHQSISLSAGLSLSHIFPAALSHSIHISLLCLSHISVHELHHPLYLSLPPLKPPPPLSSQNRDTEKKVGEEEGWLDWWAGEISDSFI